MTTGDPRTVTPDTIASLPKRLQDALSMTCIGQDGWASRAALKMLERRGLVVAYQADVYGTGPSAIDRIPVTVTRYDVPMQVHIAWAKWCSAQVEEVDY